MYCSWYCVYWPVIPPHTSCNMRWASCDTTYRFVQDDKIKYFFCRLHFHTRSTSSFQKDIKKDMKTRYKKNFAKTKNTQKCSDSLYFCYFAKTDKRKIEYFVFAFSTQSLVIILFNCNLKTITILANTNDTWNLDVLTNLLFFIRWRYNVFYRKTVV